MSVIKEFKEFAVKGNVVDMAVGIIIGAAFGKIVSSFVADVVTPPLGLLLGGVDFRGLKLTLQHAAGSASEVTLNYGVFLQTVFDFAIVAAALFALIKAINTLKKQDAAAPATPPAPSKEAVLLTEIRDILKTR
jgi:large conductance mechanosensitive channel